MLKRWPLIVTLMLCGGVALATDAYFAGRALRMTRVAASTCDASAYSCAWFDTGSRERFWNGVTSLFTVNTTEGTPTAGKVLYGNGTNWVSLAAGTSKQVLTTQVTDGGVTQLRWVSPTDAGHVTP